MIDEDEGPTDQKVGTFKERVSGDIEVELHLVPGSGQMILRRKNMPAPQNG
jgi:hypothetical protein